MKCAKLVKMEAYHFQKEELTCKMHPTVQAEVY